LNPDESNVENRIYKFAWKDNKLQNPLLLNILPADAIMHHGGTLVVDLDGNVFASVGDHGFKTSIQNYDNDIIADAGIILRVGYDQDFKSPSVSPNPLDHYYAIGIRNSFGLAVDPKTGYLWDTENGPEVYDEINLIYPKFNSGWAKILGPSSDTISLNYTPDFSYSDPEFSWEFTVAPTGISFVDEKWDKYQNSIFVGDCKGGNLYRFELNDSRDGFIFESPDLQDLVLNELDNDEEIIFGKNFGCITDVEYSSDGYLYVISYLNNGAIYKIHPK
jgi:glucose/arabinose dehydrogenase